MLKLTLTLTALGLLTALALTGCNAVLGIDEAHRAAESTLKQFDADKNPATSAVPQFAEKCEKPTDDCAECQAANDCADSSKMECLADSKCRFALDAYRTCLGNPCSDGNGECLTALAKLEGSSLAGLHYVGCVNRTCPEVCEGSPLISPCEEYCGCMVVNCTDEVKAFGTDFNECVTSCNAVAPAAILCRWTHCEMAPHQINAGHCRHALGDGRCAAQTATQPACTERSQNDFICEKSTDCCSNFCNHGFCEAAQ